MPKQVLFTCQVAAKLVANGRASREAGRRLDHVPVVKIFDPCGLRTWLITECDPDEPDLLYGLFGDGDGFTETGFVLRSDLETMTAGVLGFPIERDLRFVAKRTLSGYVELASRAHRLVE